MMRRTTFSDRPARGGSMTATSGARLLDELAHRDADVAGVEGRVVDLVEARVLDRVGDRVLDELDADHLPRARGEREADRPDAAVEVEDPLVAAQAGELGGDAVEDLGHLGVGLEERLGRDQEAQVAEVLVQLRGAGQQLGLPALGGLAEPGGLRPQQAVGVDRVEQRVGVELARAR